MTTDHILQRIVRETTVSTVQLEKITEILRDVGGHWSTTPPTQEGWYWWRHGTLGRTLRWFSPIPVDALAIAESGMLCYWLWPKNAEWWSEPIKEPK